MAVPGAPHLDVFTEPGSALMKLSPFLKHLYSMLGLPDADPSILCWLSSGNGFLVLDRGRLCQDVLPLYVKTRNYSSFLRQVSFYQFRKIPNSDLTADDLPVELCRALLATRAADGTDSAAKALASADVHTMRQELSRTAAVRDILCSADVFKHDDFLRTNPLALLKITRRVPQKRQYAATKGAAAGAGSSRDLHYGGHPGAMSAFTSRYNAPMGGHPAPPYTLQPAAPPPAAGFTSFSYSRAGPPAGPAGQPPGGMPAPRVPPPPYATPWAESVQHHPAPSALDAAGALANLATGGNSSPRNGPQWLHSTHSGSGSGSHRASTASPRTDGGVGGPHMGGSTYSPRSHAGMGEQEAPLAMRGGSFSPRAPPGAAHPVSMGPYASAPPTVGAVGHLGLMPPGGFFTDHNSSPRMMGGSPRMAVGVSPRMVAPATASPRPASTSPRAFMSEPSHSPRYMADPGPVARVLPPGMVALRADTPSPRAVHHASRPSSPRQAAVHSSGGVGVSL